MLLCRVLSPHDIATIYFPIVTKETAYCIIYSIASIHSAFDSMGCTLCGSRIGSNWNMKDKFCNDIFKGKMIKGRI